MSRVRDDARRNKRREFALYHDDGEPVAAFWMIEADGCEERYVSGPDYGVGGAGSFSEFHDPGSHVLGVFGTPVLPSERAS